MTERQTDLRTKIAVTVAAHQLVEAKRTASPEHQATAMQNLVEMLAQRPGALTALEEIHG